MSYTKLINNKNGLGPHEFLHELVNIFTKTESTDYSKYFEISDNIDLRLSDHYSNAETFKGHKNKDENFGIVIKISKGKFKTSEGVNYLEYIFPRLNNN